MQVQPILVWKFENDIGITAFPERLKTEDRRELSFHVKSNGNKYIYYFAEVKLLGTTFKSSSQ